MEPELENQDQIPEMDEVLQKALIFIQDEAKSKLIEDGRIVPFTAMIARDVLFVENHPGDIPEICFDLARNHVTSAEGARGYIFCYDGYVDTTEGQVDAIIIEGALSGDAEGVVIALMYEKGEDGFEFDEEAVYLGQCDSFMKDLPSPTDEGEEFYLNKLSKYYPEVTNYDVEEA